MSDLEPSFAGQLMRTLGRRMSLVQAHAALAQALRESGVRAINSAADVRALRGALERELRRVLPASTLAELSADLTRQFIIGTPPAERIAVATEPDVAEARMRAWAMCGALGANRTTTQKAATIVSELARNIYMYTPGGDVELSASLGTPARMWIRAQDRGGGIADLAAIMNGSYRSRSGLGAGLRGTKRLADTFSIETGASGTRVEAGLDL